MTETATDVREQAQEKAQEAASKASDTVRTQVDQRSTQAGEKIASTAGDIRSVGEQLRQQGKDQPAQLADKAAQHVERAGSWLRESDADKILHDVEDFGRRQPLALALGGLALGFAASRFLKASSSQRYDQRRQAPAVSNGAGNGHAPEFGAAPPVRRDPSPQPPVAASPVTTTVPPAAGTQGL
ncbi:MAG: hypothetical protein QOH13_2151 [Thermoleophilaceae bacterium]|nr:hypothetical protein [Thermoleophilaceae bacterium]